MNYGFETSIKCRCEALLSIHLVCILLSTHCRISILKVFTIFISRHSFFSVNAIAEAFSDYCENFRKVSLAALHMSAAAAPCLLSSSPGLGGARLGPGTLLGSPDSIPDGGLARNCAVPSSRGSRGRNL